MKKYDVLCPFCCGTFLETNGKYSEEKPANGSMFDVKQQVLDAGWTVFPLYDTTEYANVVCPSCQQCLLDSHGMIVRKVHCGEVDEWQEKRIITRIDYGGANAMMDEMMAEYEPELPSPWNGLKETRYEGTKDNLFMTPSLLSNVPRKPGRPKKV
jgi:hypothetical protein